MQEAMELGCEQIVEMEEDCTLGAVYESIETNLWLAEAYLQRGAEGLSAECLRAAWMEYLRFRDILCVYDGSESLGRRVIAALMRQSQKSGALIGLEMRVSDELLRCSLAS
jgi:hypothetical protein